MSSTKRAILVVLDSVGVGHGRDAHKFFNGETPDTGANTLGHISAFCTAGKADGRAYSYDGKQLREERCGSLHLPNLKKAGFFAAAELAAGTQPIETPAGLATSLHEVAAGKDTTSGHMEICGLKIEKDWGYFPRTEPSFPADFIEAWLNENNLSGVLGNCHASGTDIIERHGLEHVASGKLIAYTSVDSVFQIAAHEETFGLDRLYEVCASAREMLDPLNIARVIARPFVGTTPANFKRTNNRKDFAMPPPGETLLDVCQAEGVEVHAIGKISDIFNGKGVATSTKASGLPQLFDKTLEVLQANPTCNLTFVNFVDFDTEFGHRRDAAGYAAALEYFDSRLPEILGCLADDDLMAICADHGNDPTWVGTDHTREQIPLLLVGNSVVSGTIPPRETFADIGQTLATHLGVSKLKFGSSII